MTPEMIGGVGILVLLGLILLRIPVAVAMGLVGFAGYVAIEGWTRATLVIGGLPRELMTGYALSVVPLFVLMGEERAPRASFCADDPGVSRLAQPLASGIAL